MADKRKSIDEIRPARGVKLKRKIKKTKEELDKRVVENVQGEQGEVTDEAARMLGDLNNARQEYMTAMKDFNSLLNSKVLPENRSTDDKNKENDIIKRLVLTAQKVEELTGNSGDAILGMCVFAVRQSLSLRDAGNRLAYELSLLKKEVELIKNDVYEVEA